MNGPNSYTRPVAVARTITAAGVTLDLYAPPAGPGWRTPAGPIFDLAGVQEADRLDLMPRLGLTGALGIEIAWEHPKPIGLLSRSAVAAVLANAVAEVDPATVAAIDAALAA